MANCKIKRRKLVTHGTMSLGGGKIKYDKQEWVEEECGTPIFSMTSKDIPVCSSCLKGWTNKNNFMMDTPENKKLMEKAKSEA